MKINNHTYYALVLSFILLLVTSRQAVAMNDCEEGGQGQSHSTLRATVSLNLTGAIKKNDELGRASFVRLWGNGGVAQCGENAQVYGYTSYGEGSGIVARYYGEIDGRPAYHVHRGGSDSIVYVLIDDDSQESFRNKPGQALPVPKGPLLPINATIIFYAAKDNPESTYFNQSIVGTVLINRYSSGGGTTRTGYTYELKGAIESAPTSCSAENTDLEFNLPPLSTAAFSSIGFPSEASATEDNMRIICTGDMSASIKLLADNTRSYQGKQSIITLDNEGESNHASGIGFTVKSPLSHDTFLENNEFVKLADLKNGETDVPLIAEYYRYGDSITPGKAEATAQFVLQFD